MDKKKLRQAVVVEGKYDQNTLRQLVDTVKVNSAEKITVFLRGGIQVEQDRLA